MRPQDFYTREPASAGRRVDLMHADGSPSGEWMQIRSVLSDEYESAARALPAMAIKDLVSVAKASHPADAKRLHKKLRREQKARLVGSLIAAWSFDLDCTEEEKIKLLVSAPRLRRQIELISESIFIARSRHE